MSDKTKVKIQRSKSNSDEPVSKDLESLKSQLARALADYDNLRKRSEAEKNLWMKFAKQSLLVRLLPVLDGMELAQKHLKDKGIEMTESQFKNILKEEGIEEITDVDSFDEQKHEAIDIVDGGEKGKISEVLQKGYRFSDGEVIRPAKVRVFKGEN